MRFAAWKSLIFVIAPNTIDDEAFYKFHTDLRELLKFIKYSKDKTKLEAMVLENERFRHMDGDGEITAIDAQIILIEYLEHTVAKN